VISFFISQSQWFRWQDQSHSARRDDSARGVSIPGLRRPRQCEGGSHQTSLEAARWVAAGAALPLVGSQRRGTRSALNERPHFSSHGLPSS